MSCSTHHTGRGSRSDCALRRHRKLFTSCRAEVAYLNYVEQGERVVVQLTHGVSARGKPWRATETWVAGSALSARARRKDQRLTSTSTRLRRSDTARYSLVCNFDEIAMDH